MKLRSVFKNENFEWIDIVDPQKPDLEKIAIQYGLHSTSVQDCLDPEHLPKFEKINEIYFLIFRAYDENCPAKGDSVQELTRKIAVFYSSKFLLTIHRSDQPFLVQIRESWQTSPPAHDAQQVSVNILSDLVRGILASYEKPIDASFIELESLEMGAFGVAGAKPFKIKSAYYLKRRTFVFKMIVRFSNDVISKFTTAVGGSNPKLQDLKEISDSLFFYADELLENITTLIGLHISLSTQKTTEASYKTGEVVRVLTIFSIFLLPLNVITGIYGMNFENMPELKYEHGYFLALTMMVVLLISLYIWLHKKGWLKAD